MPPELHMRPDRLHDHARSASGLAQELHAALRGAPEGVDVEPLRHAIGAAVRELEEMSTALRVTAAAGSAADTDVSAAFTRIRDALGRP